MGREPPRVELLREQAIAGEIREILQPHMHVRRFAKGEIITVVAPEGATRKRRAWLYRSTVITQMLLWRSNSV